MPAPYAITRSNRYLLNPLARRLAGWVPPFVLIEHVGRVSGKPFRTPVFGFRDGDHGAVVVALTYGPEVDWIKNLRAAGGGRVVTRGGTFEVASPEIRTELAESRAVPWPLKPILSLLRGTDVARLRPRTPPAPTANDGRSTARTG